MEPCKALHKESRAERPSDQGPDDSLRDESNVSGAWLPSLIVTSPCVVNTPSSIAQVGEALFVSAHSTTKSTVLDADFLKSLHIEGDANRVFRELLILRFYAIMKGVEGCRMPAESKTDLLDCVHAVFFRWLREQLGCTESEVDSVKAILGKRYRAYEDAYNHIVHNRPLAAGEVLLDSLRDILAPDLSAEDVFDLLPLHSMFSRLLLTFSDAVRKSLSEAGVAALD